MLHDLFRGAPQEEPRHSAIPVGPANNQIGRKLARRLADFVESSAGADVTAQSATRQRKIRGEIVEPPK